MEIQRTKREEGARPKSDRCGWGRRRGRILEYFCGHHK